ncbi:MAG: GFA family protein [Rhodospirillales bacterium]|nr:GFA family protein [Rhodospirillales bacterium]
MPEQRKGSCQCGAVTYSVAVDPLWVGHCQCTNCQKFTGAGHATNMVVPREAVAVQGELKTYSYEADSGNHMKRHFCPTCGSPVYGESSGNESVVVIRVGTLDDPASVTPQAVIYTERGCSWDTMDPALQSFPGMIKR